MQNEQKISLKRARSIERLADIQENLSETQNSGSNPLRNSVIGVPIPRPRNVPPQTAHPNKYITSELEADKSVIQLTASIPLSRAKKIDRDIEGVEDQIQDFLHQIDAVRGDFVRKRTDLERVIDCMRELKSLLQEMSGKLNKIVAEDPRLLDKIIPKKLMIQVCDLEADEKIELLQHTADTSFQKARMEVLEEKAQKAFHKIQVDTMYSRDRRDRAYMINLAQFHLCIIEQELEKMTTYDQDPLF